MRRISRYAKFDPAHILDGLFVPKVMKGLSLYEVCGTFDGGTVSFKGCQLGVEHQSVLMALAARTGQQEKAQGLIIQGAENDLKGLFVDGEAKNAGLAQVECSAYAILADAGMGDRGSDYKKLKSLLHEMATVTLYREYQGKGGSSRLLSFEVNQDSICVSLNWRLADAIFGGQHFRLSLHERHGLRSPVAKVLHTWLSAYIRPDGKLAAGRGARIDILIPHIWGKRPASDEVFRKRRQYTRAALKEIGKLEGWMVRLEADKTFVSRPKELPYAQRGKEMLPGDLAERLSYDPYEPDNNIPK